MPETNFDWAKILTLCDCCGRPLGEHTLDQMVKCARKQAQKLGHKLPARKLTLSRAQKEMAKNYVCQCGKKWGEHTLDRRRECNIKRLYGRIA